LGTLGQHYGENTALIVKGGSENVMKEPGGSRKTGDRFMGRSGREKNYEDPERGQGGREKRGAELRVAGKANGLRKRSERKDSVKALILNSSFQRTHQGGARVGGNQPIIKKDEINVRSKRREGGEQKSSSKEAPAPQPTPRDRAVNAVKRCRRAG